MRFSSCVLAFCVCAAAVPAWAEPCVTQSQMLPADRAALVQAAVGLAELTAADNVSAIRADTMPQFAADFKGISDAAHNAAPHLRDATFVPDTVWILDASAKRPDGDSTPQDAQFFCTLNRTGPQTTFLIPSLPQGRYGLAVLNTVGLAEPWQVTLLMRQAEDGKWQLGGLFPRATTAAGHDGLWFWRTAREVAGKKQAWNAWIDYTEAEALLKPVSFVTSAHLELLESERSRSAPAALASGIGQDQPLVIAPASGAEVRVTSLGAEPAPDHSHMDVLAHVQAADALTDPAVLRTRNRVAAKALVAAYPELRSAFHGFWIVTDLPGGGNYTSEEPMTDL